RDWSSDVCSSDLVEKTLNEPSGRVRMSTPRTKTGLSVKSAALRCDATISATAPSSGEQNMYWVSGGLIGRDAAIASSVIGVRRNAEGVIAPLRYAFAATFANDASEIP